MMFNFKDGRMFRVTLREGREKEKYFIFKGDVMAIREPSDYGRDIYFIAFENEYNTNLTHKKNSKLDIMKVYDEIGKLIWDREEEDNRTDWSKVELGTDVEYFKDGEWVKARFILFNPSSKVILMTDGKDVICNHTENTVRLIDSQDEIKKETVRCFPTPFGIVKITDKEMDDFLEELLDDFKKNLK